MVVSAVQSNNTNKNSGTSYLLAAVTGIGTGFIARDLVPLTKSEKDLEFYSSLESIKANAKKFKIDEIEKIRASKTKTEAMDTFVKLCDQKKLNYFEIKKLDKKISREILSKIMEINLNANALKADSTRVLIAGIKDLRPRFTFAAIGAVIGAGFALLHNLFKPTDTKETD